MSSDFGNDPRFTRTVTIELTLAKRAFPFNLYFRQISLGEAGDVKYYWMDSSLWRKGLGASDDDLQNLRSCIGIWWRTMQIAQTSLETFQLRHLLRACCYGVFAKDKSLQNVFHDAHLSHSVSRFATVDDDSNEQSTAIEAGNERETMRAALHALLMDSVLSENEALVIQVSIEAILDEGIKAFKDDRQKAILDFVNKIDSWSSNVRKRGGNPLRRQCLNQFAYLSKVSFYHCYAAAWTHIIDALEQQGLDELSSRFMRFWHWQNSPNVRCDGSSEPDAFGGQILALHPLSAFFMQDSRLLNIAGRLFSCMTSEEFDAQSYSARHEYGAFLGAILLAAQRYENARQEHSTRRPLPKGDPPHRSGGISAGTNEVSLTSISESLTEFLAASGRRCSRCQGALECRNPALLTSENDVAHLGVKCRNCQHEEEVEIAGDQLKAFLFGD